MPSGATVYYQDECERFAEEREEDHRCKGGACHSYWTSPERKRHQRVAGISTIAKRAESPSTDPLMHWACKFVDRPGGWEAERRRLGDIGTAAHKVLEHLADHDEVPPLAGGHQMAVVGWWKSRRPDVIHSEQIVYHEELGFAGRFDLLAGHATPTLYDLKTGAIREAAVLQMQMYRLACKASGLTVPERLVILDTHSDGEGFEIEVPINEAWVFAAIEMHRAGKEMGVALRAAQKAAVRWHAAAPLAEAA